jgi:hypothetical protein
VVLQSLYRRTVQEGDDVSMRSRRFLLVVAGLVALNLVLWLAPAGLALRQAVINQLFGPRMIRAEVVLQGVGGATQDYLIDRGVVTAVAADSLVLREQDGKVQTIPLGPTTQVSGLKRFTSVASLRKNLRVLVIRLANGPASVVQVEARAGGGAAAAHGPPVP